MGVTYIHPCLKQLRYQKKLQVTHSNADANADDNAGGADADIDDDAGGADADGDDADGGGDANADDDAGGGAKSCFSSADLFAPG